MHRASARPVAMHPPSAAVGLARQRVGLRLCRRRRLRPPWADPTGSLPGRSVTVRPRGRARRGCSKLLTTLTAGVSSPSATATLTPAPLRQSLACRLFAQQGRPARDRPPPAGHARRRRARDCCARLRATGTRLGRPQTDHLPLDGPPCVSNALLTPFRASLIIPFSSFNHPPARLLSGFGSPREVPRALLSDEPAKVRNRGQQAWVETCGIRPWCVALPACPSVLVRG